MTEGGIGDTGKLLTGLDVLAILPVDSAAPIAITPASGRQGI